MVAAAFGAVTTVAIANPQGAKVVSGSATITNSGNSLVIKNTPGAIINWQSFSIGAGETTNFIQQSVNSAILNRVVGVDPSVILGTLTSNGHVYLVNPNGVVFGKGAMVDAAGLVVSSLDITDQDFKNGTLRFVGSDTSGSISVAGVLRSSDGDVYLIAPNITNSGSITAVNGNVTLAAGQDVEILGNGLTDIQFNVQNKGNTAVNLGQINGDAVGIFAGTITQAGGVNATTATVAGGKVILSAPGDITLASGSTTSADNAAGTAGSVAIQSGTGNISVAQGASVSASGATGGLVTLLASGGSALVTGSIAASGTMGLGGSVDVLGTAVALNSGALVDASGAAGGGKVMIGGSPGQSAIQNATTTSVAAGATVSANANGSGNGGDVTLYSTGTTTLHGNIDVLGGTQGGNGGTVETSGKAVDIDGLVGLGAPSGKGGTWLIDPDDVVIQAVATGGSNPSTVSTAGIQYALSAGGTVVVATASYTGSSVSSAYIDVNAPINVATTAYGGTLTLQAGGPININSSIANTIGTNGGPLTLNLTGNLDGAGGVVSVYAPITLPGGTVSMQGSGFYNATANTITASTITGSFAGVTPTDTFTNLGTFDASGVSNGTNSPGSINISATVSNSTAAVALGTMNADNGYGLTAPAGTINIFVGGTVLTDTPTLSANASNGTGIGGTINITAPQGISFLTGTSISANGANSDQLGQSGGIINLSSGAGSISLAGTTFNANGGSSGPDGDTLPGGTGGTISIVATGDISLSGTNVYANGGTGGELGIGGSGGSIGITAGGMLNLSGASLIDMLGGAGGTSYGSNNAAGAGGAGGQINLTGGSVSVSGSSLFASGGVGGLVQDVEYAGDLGGAGGVGGRINVSAYSGAISFINSSADVSGGAGGLGGAGGNGGGILIFSLSASSPVDLTGSQLTSLGGLGGAGAESGDGGNPVFGGGAGGQGGTISITAGGGVSLQSSTIFAIGGGGGDGAAGNNLNNTTYSGTDGGAGGAGGSIGIYVDQLSGGPTLAIGANSSVEANGAAGGAGGDYNASVPGTLDYATAGNGGAGGNAGAIYLYANGPINIDSSLLANMGGTGGSGGNVTGPNPLAVAGNGGNGGLGNIISITTDNLGVGVGYNVTLTGDNIVVSGGAGGAGGVPVNGQGGGGDGGSGGDSQTSGNDAVSIIAAGSISIDAATSISSLGGTGGSGGSAPGYQPVGYAIGPGSGGNGGTAGSIFFETNNSATGVDGTISALGSITVQGGAGGIGGDIQTSGITSNGMLFTAGNGGVGGWAGQQTGEHGALAITSLYGGVTLGGTIELIGGTGGNGGNTVDLQFGPGNAGSGGSVMAATVGAAGGDLNLTNNTITLQPGGGGTGGNAPINGSIATTGGLGGNDGNYSALSLSASGNVNLIDAQINFFTNSHGTGGTGTSNGFDGNYPNEPQLNLSSGGGSIEQTDGQINGGYLFVNASALTDVNLNSTINNFTDLQTFASNGAVDIYSSQYLTVDSAGANSAITITTPYQLSINGLVSDNGTINLSAGDGYAVAFNGGDAQVTSQNGLVSIQGGSISINGSGVTSPFGGINLSATTGGIDIGSTVDAGAGDVNVSAAGYINVQAQVTSDGSNGGGSVNMSAGTFVEVAGPISANSGSVTISAASSYIDVANSIFAGNGQVGLFAGDYINVSDTVSATDSINISGANAVNINSPVISDGYRLSKHATASSTSTRAVQSGNYMQLRSGNLVLDAGTNLSA